MKKTNNKLKIIFVLLNLYIIANAIAYAIISANETNKIDIALNANLKNIETHYKLILHNQEKISSSIYEQTFSNPRVKKILSEANNEKDSNKLALLRNELESILHNHYLIYQKEGVLQYHFTLPNNKVFLRMHKPSKFNDDISNIRLDFKYVNEQKKAIHGFHKGKTSHAFRNISPVFDSNKKLIAALDIGFSSHELQHELNHISKIDTHFLVNKDIFTTKAWTRNDIKAKYIQSNEHIDYMMGITHTFNDDKYIKNGKNLEKYKDEIAQGIKTKKQFSILINNKDELKVLSFYPINSTVTNKTSSWLVAYTNNKLIEIALMDRDNIFIISAIVLFILFLFIYNLLIRKDQLNEQIKIKTHSLSLVNEELNQANDLMKNKSAETLNLLGQYKDTIDSALCVSKTDLKGNITYVNDIFCKLSGFKENELLGKSYNILKHPENTDDLYRGIWETITNKNIWNGSISNLNKNNKIYYIHATIAPILDIKGNITEFISISEDITEQILLENKTKQILNRTKQIMNSQESMIIISDKVNGIIEANQILFDLTGFNNLEEFTQKYSCVCELFVEQDGYLKTSKDDFFWTQPVLSNPNDTHKALIVDTYGNEIIYKVRGKEIQLDGLAYEIFTFSDITDIEKMRVKAESSQRAKSDFLANMSHEIRTPMNGISGFLQLLEKTNLDKKQEKYLNITQSSMKTLLQIINDILDFSKIESGHMQSELILTNPFVEFEKSFLVFMPKAKEKDISYQIQIESNLHEMLYMDILHIKQVMQNLINNAIKFTQTMGTIIISVSAIQEKRDSIFQTLRFSVKDSGIGIEKENQEKILQAFSQADNSTTRKFGGTGLGLSISRSLVQLMGGKLSINSDLNKGSEFYFELKLKKGENKNSVSSHLKENIICVINDNDESSITIMKQLDSFNINYISHSISVSKKFLKNKNKCDLILTSNKNFAKDLLDFNDTNIILVNNDCDELQNINNLHIIDSYEVCPSSLYNMLLTHNFVNHSSGSVTQKLNLSLNILIAEDYEINRILLEEQLSEYPNINYTFVFDGQEAINHIRNNDHYDLIFMDINMPIIDGIKATKIIRKMGKVIPIVALTANALAGDKERFLGIGMNDYISKPIDIKELERVLKNYSTTSDTIDDVITYEALNESANDNIIIDNKSYMQENIQKTIISTKFPEKTVMKLFNSYINSSSNLLSTFKTGIDNNNFEAIRSATHDIKSSSLTLNYTHIGNLAAEVENAATLKIDFEYENYFNSIKEHFMILEDCLKKQE